MPQTKHTTKSNGKYVGARVLRKEDPRLLSGKGAYVDDIHLPNTAHLAILRSPHANARIQSINVSRAQALEGVLDVVTGADLKDHLPPIAPMGALPDMKSPDNLALAIG